ncbi:VWA domain-containing protein [Metabacillus sp. cB07]|uniref:VWA domain-containing protein n=1 Tax=Metabacillus sp. cB07 TaxID=2806989 RepID=UPI00193981DB|nr:VWA domain-containing protein [Metabacillus sp. cB07]
MKSTKRTCLMLLSALFVFFALAACGGGEQASGGEDKKENAKKEEAATEKEKEDEVEIAGSLEDIVKEEPGKYSGNAYNKAVIHKALDEKSFADKDSFQIYGELLNLVNEGENYKPYYDFYEEFNPSIETSLSNMPGGMTLENGEIGLNTNISILLDASGSMAQKIGGQTKMDLAKKAVNDFVASMPEGANVSLRVYGQEGSNSDSDKKLSCDSTEVVYDLKPYNEAEFKDSLGKFKPTGWTPIAKAISESKADFEKSDKQGQNIIYVVSDGIETCDGDPAKEAKELHDSNIEAVVNIIGFDVDSNGQKQLMSVAQAGGGQYETVDTAEDFQELWEDERQRLWNEWWDWGNKNWNKVWEEQSEKQNELYEKKRDLTNMIYEEKTRLNEAAFYLQEKEQIEYDVRQEVTSLVDQRHEILKDYAEDTHETMLDTVKTEGEDLKDSIQEKKEEMTDKYKKN